jgi:glycosyltransferase involved in cell wall biosynthesis
MKPRVSVIVPAYQAGSTVGAAISSVLWQTYSDVEIIVVDDGSSDQTASIARAYGALVRLVQQPNTGVASARNRGIQESTGELVTFCDADDFLFPQHIEALVAAVPDAGGLATANAYWMFPGGIKRSKVRSKGRFPAPSEQRRAILEQNFVSIMSVFPRSLVSDIGPFDEGLRRAEDWDFWMRAIFAGHRVALQPRPLALIRWGSSSLTSARDAMDTAVLEVLGKAIREIDLSNEERDYLRLRLSGPGPHALARRGDAALRAGRYPEAARLYREAAEILPSERRLVWKARFMANVPSLAGALVRARQRRIEDDLAFDEDHVR